MTSRWKGLPTRGQSADIQSWQGGRHQTARRVPEQRRADIAGTGLVLLPLYGCCHCSRASELLWIPKYATQAMWDLASIVFGTLQP
jgi:hypothetical protein